MGTDLCLGWLISFAANRKMAGVIYYGAAISFLLLYLLYYMNTGIK